MKSRVSARRAAAAVLAAGLLFVLVGDRAMTATPSGIDPLDVLNLQIKPNVLIVLDTSGSMTDSPGNNVLGGDHPDAKLASAKRVLRQAVTDNESKVNMMFGTYTNEGTRFARTTVAPFTQTDGRGPGSGPVQDRFTYWTDTGRFPSMATTPLTAGRMPSVAEPFGNLVFAYQIIGDGTAPNARTNNNLLYFREIESASANQLCTATIPPRFYQSGADLATAMQTAMNNAPCNRQNTYAVTYNAATGIFSFAASALVRTFEMDWVTPTNSIRAVLNAIGVATASGPGPFLTRDARIPVMRRLSALLPLDQFTENGVTYFSLVAGRFFNGETFYVQSNGNVCDMTSGPPSTTEPFVNLQLITGTTCPAPTGGYGSATGTSSGTPVGFIFGGGLAEVQGNGGWHTNQLGCTGFQIRTQLRSCDNTTGQALEISTPFLEPQFQIATAPGAAPPAGVVAQAAGGLVNREETLEGVGRWDATGGDILSYGVVADGSTPIANTLGDLKQVFTRYYNGGGNPPATVGTVTIPPSGRIDQHIKPAERTIVLLITDGDDTCSGTGDAAARAAAAESQTLYTPIVGGVQNPSGQYTAGTDPASSVVTYVVGYGTAAQQNRLNMIAWGGSGMRFNFGGATNPTAGDRLLCQTCQDAYLAPDPATLASVLQAIFDQGAQFGEFGAQQSITGSIYEYVDQARSDPAAVPYDPRNPTNRYQAFTPVKFVSTFSLPGFNGQVKAYSNACNDTTDPANPKDAATGAACAAGDDSLLLWSAGDKLTNRIAARMTNVSACPIAANAGAVDGECSFTQLHGGATYVNVGTSSAAIRRRIYTTSQNGYFFPATVNPSVADLLANRAPFRVALWPPQTTGVTPVVAPTDTSPGLFDEAMGLPLNTAADPAAEFATLQTRFRACKGTLPAGSPAATNCGSASAATRMQQARREAREMILAFMAGAQVVPDSNGDPKRVASGANAGVILYKAKPWALGEATLATPAEVPPPFGSPIATPYVLEFTKFKEGARDNNNRNPNGSTTTDFFKGFGLANPDQDDTWNTAESGGAVIDTRAAKPVMSVLYAGANDMLHAFRAGPSTPLGFTRSAGACGSQITVSGQKQMSTALAEIAAEDCGGEEIWGFVPFDQLGKLYTRLVNHPAKRDPHDFMIARGIRFADVFVPGAVSRRDGPGVDLQGLWRKVLFFGRGAGGKYMTALDVTAPGTFRTRILADNLPGPIPLWSRGNPDTTNGKVGGTAVHDATDTAAYARMGQTWSLPAVVLVDKTKNPTTRKPVQVVNGQPTGGVEFVAYMGSGYGDTAQEGTTFYTLDALTGDVVAAPDVEPVASSNSMARAAGDRTYTNAIVANVVAFNPSNFKTGGTAHPSASLTSRAYVADLHGRLWKVLSAAPNVVLPVADLEEANGPNQPVGTAASLIGLPLNQGAPKPYIFITSGNESRESGPFKIFGFRDDGNDTDTVLGAAVDANAVRTFLPVASLFTRPFDQGPVLNSAAPSPFPVFRGTSQPATAFNGDLKGIVFFAGTRFNPPLSAFAPVPVPGNASSYPCRSTFDSIIYALQAESGGAAYDLNASGDDAYVIFQESRVVGIGTQADPDPGRGGSRFYADEGKRAGGSEKPPPKPGKPASGGSNVRTANVFGSDAPVPSVRFASTVCNETYQ